MHHHDPKGHHNASHHRLNLNLSTSKHSLGGGTSSSGVSPSGVHYTTIIPNGGIPNGGIPMTPNGHVHTYSNGESKALVFFIIIISFMTFYDVLIYLH